VEIADTAPRMRGNDGNVDARGRFWAGAMNDPLVTPLTAEGVLFRLDPDLSLHRMLEGVTVPNGISWSPDDKIMYFTDSPTRTIQMYDFNIEEGTFSNGRTFFSMPEDEPSGVPDGHTWDDEGCMWIACWGTSKVFRVNGLGEIVAVVKCPTVNVSCPRLAGGDLFITSAGGKDPENDASDPYAGCVFKVHVGVQGQPSYKFKLEADV
jgi:sugar lactone lactonase YvrE